MKKTMAVICFPLVSPKEWGSSGPFKKFVAGVKLLADHTWMEL